MIFNRKKNRINYLLNSFGAVKDASYGFDLIEKYFRKTDNSKTFQILSDKTCNDLDFQELFMFVDRTNSKVGEQYLYNKLRTIPGTAGCVNHDEQLIELFSENPDFRVAIQQQLIKLNTNDTYFIISLFQDEHIKPPKWYSIVPVMSMLSIISLLLIHFYPPIFLFLCAVFAINSGIHYWNKRNLFQYLGSIPQLLVLNDVASELFKNDSLKSVNPELPESIKIIDKLRSRMSFFKLDAKLEGDLNMIFWAFLEFIKTLFLLEPLLLFGVLKQLDTKRKEVEDAFIYVGHIDSLVSIASLRQGLDKYCLPKITDNQKTIIAKEAYHPLMANCVENSIDVNQKSILLTGSNMSGKTSFIRTIGINSITALTLNTCFADYFELPRMKIFSAIRISDDLINDKSYYFEEVLTIKEMITESEKGKANLFLLDEIYKGTNTIERIAAGKAVLSSMAKGDNIVFVSTHDIELADLLKDEYELYHFSERVEDHSVDFDYKLKDGKLKNRNAIRILEINNYPDSVIQEAIELSKRLDQITGTVKEV